MRASIPCHTEADLHRLFDAQRAAFVRDRFPTLRQRQSALTRAARNTCGGREPERLPVAHRAGGPYGQAFDALLRVLQRVV